MSPRNLLFEVVLVELLLLVFFAGVLHLPVATSFLTIAICNLVFLLWLVSGNVVRNTPSSRRLLADPMLFAKTPFLSVMGGNIAFLSLIFYLLFSGIPLAFNELMSGASSYGSLVLHFLIGMAVVSLSVSYAVVKTYNLQLRYGSLQRAIGSTVVDFAAGVSILLLFLFITQFLPVILMYILTMGLGCLAALVVAVYLTRRSGRFPSARSWLSAWANAVFYAPLGIVILLLFGYGQFHTHFSNSDILQWHSSFAVFATIAIVLAQMYRIVDAVRCTPRRLRMRVFFSAAGRLVAAFLIALLLFKGVDVVSTKLLDVKAIHDYLLPVR